MSSQVLLVGGRSPIGSAIATKLRVIGHQVTATSRTASGDLIELDVIDSAAVGALLASVRPSSVLCLASPIDHLGTSTDWLERFVELAAEFGAARFVFASSAAVYGTVGRHLRCEDDTIAPESLYGEAKAASEQTLSQAGARHGIETVALRIFNVYGHGLNLSLINRMFNEDSSPPDVYDTARFIRDYVHVSDVARAFAASIDSPSFSSTAINVGTGVPTDNRWLLSLPNSRGTRVAVDDDFESHSVADTTRMASELGLHPATLVRLKAQVDS